MFLAVIPLSEGYDFLGEPNHKNQAVKGAIPERIEEEGTGGRDYLGKPVHKKKETKDLVKEELLKDKKNLPKPRVLTPEEEGVKPRVVEPKEEVKPLDPEGKKVEVAPVIDVIPQTESTLPEPQDIPVQEKKSNFTEIDFEILSSGNAMDNLPANASGNYVIIYRSDDCPYCDKLISELKGNIGDYHLVVVRCTRRVRDPFYTRLIMYFPSFIVITNKTVRYYGYGYRPLEEFKRFL